MRFSAPLAPSQRPLSAVVAAQAVWAVVAVVYRQAVVAPRAEQERPLVGSAWCLVASACCQAEPARCPVVRAALPVGSVAYRAAKVAFPAVAALEATHRVAQWAMRAPFRPARTQAVALCSAAPRHRLRQAVRPLHSRYGPRLRH